MKTALCPFLGSVVMYIKKGLRMIRLCNLQCEKTRPSAAQQTWVLLRPGIAYMRIRWRSCKVCCTKKHSIQCNILKYTKLVSCGNDLLTCGNDFPSYGNYFLSCGNDMLSCGTNLLSCGNNFLTCSNDLLPYSGYKIKNDRKTVLCPFLGSVGLALQQQFL